MEELLIGLIYLLAMVATLIIAVIVASWLYRRDLDRRIKKGEPADAAPISPAASGPRRPAPTTTVDEARADAEETTARTRRAQVAAWLGYAAVTLIVVTAYLGMPLVSIVGAIYALVMPQLVILTWSLRWPRRRSLLAVLLFAAAGAALLLPIWAHRRLTALSVSQLIVVFLIAPAVILGLLFARQLRAFVLLVLAVVIAFGGVALYLVFVRPETVPDGFRTVAKEPLAVTLGLVAIIAGVVIAVVLLRSGRVVRLAGFAVALAGAVFLDRAFGRLPLATLAIFAVAGIVVQLFILWGSFKLLVSLHLTNELVQTHLCWILLIAYFAAATLSNFFADPVPARWGLFLALVPYLVTLHTLLFRIRKRRPRVAPMRLLLLRVFGRADRHEGLLRDLDDTWRRIGAVDLIASADVASRTLTSTMLEAFFLRRSDEEFLKTAAEVDRRIDALRFDIEVDTRYPVNPVYCYRHTWQRAFTRLAAGANAVLMDLRGFTAENKGCAWELDYLLRNFDVERIVLLTNDLTETEEIERIKRDAGVMREFDVGDKPLFDRLLRAALS